MPRGFTKPQTWGTVLCTWGDQGQSESCAFGAVVLASQFQQKTKNGKVELSIVQSTREVDISLAEAESILGLLSKPEEAASALQVKLSSI
jgi:hypothetical protein